MTEALGSVGELGEVAGDAWGESVAGRWLRRSTDRGRWWSPVTRPRSKDRSVLAGPGPQGERAVGESCFPLAADGADLEEFRRAGADVARPGLTGVWILTGRAAEAEELCCAGYWVRHAREAVRFAQGVNWLAGEGVTRFIEVGPDGVLAAMTQECLEEVTHDAANAVVIPSSGTADRTGSPFTCLARVFVTGVPVDWAAVIPGGGDTAGQAGGGRVGVVDLPTYAFQRQRYWLEATAGPADTTGLGLAPLQHPLLGAVVSLAEGGQAFTGRLSLQSHPWLADHQVLGVVLVPGTALVEFALSAADYVGCGGVEELTLDAPLVVPDRGGVQLQVVVGEADQEGRRNFSVHSRLEDADAVWSRHASGVLVVGDVVGDVGVVLEQWPPVGAELVVRDLDEFYETFSRRGYDYGPAFRGLEAVWRRGEEVFAQVRLAEERLGEVDRFGVHPALLDAALHAVAVIGDESQEARVPFAWSGVRLHAMGASVLRVRLTRAGSDAVALAVADAAGQPVASVDSLAMRPVSAQQLETARSNRYDSLLQLAWQPLPSAVSTGARTTQGARWAVLTTTPATDDDSVGVADGELAGVAGGVVEAVRESGGVCGRFAGLAELVAAVDAGEPVPETVVLPCAAGALADAAGVLAGGAGVLAGGVGGVSGQAREMLAGVLAVVQAWLAQERLSASRLVVVTGGAVEAVPGEGVRALAQAPVWGLLRSAQTENPGRFTLVDIDPAVGRVPSALIPVVAAGDEPQLAVRGDELRVPA